MKPNLLVLTFVVLLSAICAPGAPLYTFTLPQNGGSLSYDSALAAASLQGIINRDTPELYLLSRTNSRPQFWLDLLAQNHRWLHGRRQKSLNESAEQLPKSAASPQPSPPEAEREKQRLRVDEEADLTALVKLAGHRLKGAVIWDPAVPATVNVATTCAGVEDAIILSPELATRYLAQWKLPVIRDLRGKFTGHETGSAKNDAYRWAIREYLAKDLCSPHRLCLFEDSFTTRAKDDESYVITRDWAIKNRAFIFDLSPWGDEKPGDDPAQPPGRDLETYKMILAETQRYAGGTQMTELTGFFALDKYSHTATHNSTHDGVPTEWESVWLMSPYNCYQNTISSDCFNQSFHSHAPRHPLKQRSIPQLATLDKKAYICILMSDYDSATPLYDFLPKYWHDANRGKLPLAWGINPSLLETYPDLIAYFYETATPADTFTADATCAGYINPNRIHKESLPLFIRHNQKFFHEADMTIAPEVLDQDQPSPDVKDAYAQFAPDGYATIIANVLGARGNFPPPQVWKGMPIIELLNDTCNSKASAEIAGIFANVIRSRGNPAPGFYFFRTDWVNPTAVLEATTLLRQQHPEINFELCAPREFFAIYKQSLEPKAKTTR